VLMDAGVVNLVARISSILPKKEVTIQYRETDFSFVSRVLEDAGIHYHYEDGDKFVLSDANTGFSVGSDFFFNPASGAGPAVLSFIRGQAVHSGQVRVGDYNWKTPTTDQTGVAQAAVYGNLADLVFPSGIDSQPEAQTQAALRLAAHVADAQICRGESTILHLQAGQRVVLKGHPRMDFNQEYVILAVEHQYGKDYRNSFRCLPVQVGYRPKQVTRKPVMAGVVPGIVVGPVGQTKYVDKYGRVKVRFPWRWIPLSELEEHGDAGWVRVGQIAAGTGSAALWLPEVGDEVIVAFEHGDPDRPVIVGSVYNGKDMPPVSLPAQQHVSLFRGGTPGGGRTELVFDGTLGNERILLNGMSVQITATGDIVHRAGRTFVTESAGDLVVKSGQNLAMITQRDAAITVGANAQIKIGQSAVVTTGHSARLTIGEDFTLQTARSIAVAAGAMFQFVAAQTGTLQVGDSFIGMNRDGNLDLFGKDIEVKSSGNLLLKGMKVLQN
jgi:type VI secretion system secreted protein VgrG